MEGETVATLNVARGPETTYVTQSELVLANDRVVSMETVEELRYDLEQRLSTFSVSRVCALIFFSISFFTMNNNRYCYYITWFKFHVMVTT